MLSSFGSARPSLAGRPNHYPPKNSILRETRLRSVIEVTIRWPDLQRKEIRIHYTGKDELTPFTCNVLAVNRICGRRRGLNHGRGPPPGEGVWKMRRESLSGPIEFHDNFFPEIGNRASLILPKPGERGPARPSIFGAGEGEEANPEKAAKVAGNDAQAAENKRSLTNERVCIPGADGRRAGPLLRPRPANSDTLDRDRDALTDADAHRRERPPAACLAQFERGGPGDAGARHAERMAERNRPAVRIDARIVVGDAELP